VRRLNEDLSAVQRDLAVVGERGSKVTLIQKANEAVAPVLTSPLAVHDQPDVDNAADLALQYGSQLRFRRAVVDVANERGVGPPRHGLIVAWMRALRSERSSEH
jgi:hypothetical protein